MELTEGWLRRYCRDENLYTTPSLNDKLFLNFKGFSTIQALDKYTVSQKTDE